MDYSNWQELNTQSLLAQLDDLKTRGYAELGKEYTSRIPIDDNLRLWAEDNSAFSVLSRAFKLNDIEQQLILFCTGVQLDNELCELCALLNDNPLIKEPSFDLALRIFNNKQWMPFSPNSSLRYWRLVDLNDPRHANTSGLHLSEMVLHYLTGYISTDPELSALYIPNRQHYGLAPSQSRLATQISELISNQNPLHLLPWVHLSGPDHEAQVAFAQQAAADADVALKRIDAGLLTNDTSHLQELFIRLEREAILYRYVYLFEAEVNNEQEAATAKSISYLLKRLSAFCLVSGRAQIVNPGRDCLKIEVQRPTYDEQLALWVNALGNKESHRKANGLSSEALKKIADQFDLDTNKIHAITHQWQSGPDLSESHNTPDTQAASLWKLCRQQCRGEVSGLAKVIEPTTLDWETLVLPDEQMHVLQTILEQVRNRSKVYQQWGFAQSNTYGLGISALFSGGSGTGKTLAARVIASALDLDIYQIDLASMVSKYIGETEKNLEKIFTAAENSGAILLFDEADALFGKRSQVNDSRDRYANMEVSYLLQRIENYSGLSILTSNYRSALDQAFIRRLRFIVQFPFPQAEQRFQIWKSVFPNTLPSQNINFEKLSRLEIPGGIIRSIAINAAFHAASGHALEMKHLRHATQDEFTKSEKTLLTELVEDW